MIQSLGGRTSDPGEFMYLLEKLFYQIQKEQMI